MKINLELHQLHKKYTIPTQYKNLLKEILSRFPYHAQVYTDASVMEDRAGMAIVHGATQVQWKLSNKCSIYTRKH